MHAMGQLDMYHTLCVPEQYTYYNSYSCSSSSYHEVSQRERERERKKERERERCLCVYSYVFNGNIIYILQERWQVCNIHYYSIAYLSECLHHIYYIQYYRVAVCVQEEEDTTHIHIVQYSRGTVHWVSVTLHCICTVVFGQLIVRYLRST